MPIQVQGNGGVTAEVEDSSTRALRIVNKPLAYSTLGHYRTNHRCVLTAAQAANSRLFTLRNSGTNFVIPTRLILKAVQSAAGTAQEASIDVFRVTGFTVVDPTSTVTPTASVKRTTGMTAAASTGAQIRGVTSTGVAAGMTGGTLVKDGNSIGQLPIVVAAAAASFLWREDIFDDVNGTHPFLLAQNEGIIIENRALNTTSYGVTLYIDMTWAEVTAF